MPYMCLHSRKSVTLLHSLTVQAQDWRAGSTSYTATKLDMTDTVHGLQ